jgi:hypothetical protein
MLTGAEESPIPAGTPGRGKSNVSAELRAFLVHSTLTALPAWMTLPVGAQKMHEHQPPEKLGEVPFLSLARRLCRGISGGRSLCCTRSVTTPITYSERWAPAIRNVAMRIGALHDTHQLWQPCLAADAYGVGREEINLAMRIGENGTGDTVIAPKVRLVILY